MLVVVHNAHYPQIPKKWSLTAEAGGNNVELELNFFCLLLYNVEWRFLKCRFPCVVLVLM